MKFKVTNVRTRPDVTVAWVSADDQASSFTNENSTTGKLLSQTNSLSEDGLTLTAVQIWTSKQIYIDYIQNPDVADLRSSRSVWQVTNMISSALTYEEVE